MKTKYETRHEVFPNGLSQVACTCGWSSFTTGFHYEASTWVYLHLERAHDQWLEPNNNLTVPLEQEAL